MSIYLANGYKPMSPSPRRAWIEMYCHCDEFDEARVALPTEGVD